MAARRDYYEVLGVPPDADSTAIKNAFRQLARRYHPDISTEPDAEQRFREIAEAYGVLSDPAKRASYDAQGFAGLAGASAEDLWGGIDLADILGPGMTAFGGLFDRLFGQAAAGPPRGQDLRADLVIPLRRVRTGGKETVTITRPGPYSRCAGSGAEPGTAPRPCPDCGGTGQQTAASRRGPVVVRQVTTCPACCGRGQVIDQPCRACDGSGQVVQEDKITIRIPRGVPEGTALRLGGRGMPSPAPGGPPGDAYVITGPAPILGSPGRAPTCATTCTSGYPTPCLAPPRPFRHSTGRHTCRCRPEHSQATCCRSKAKACLASAGTAGAA